MLVTVRSMWFKRKVVDRGLVAYEILRCLVTWYAPLTKETRLSTATARPGHRSFHTYSNNPAYIQRVEITLWYVPECPYGIHSHIQFLPIRNIACPNPNPCDQLPNLPYRAGKPDNLTDKNWQSLSARSNSANRKPVVESASLPPHLVYKNNAHYCRTSSQYANVCTVITSINGRKSAVSLLSVNAWRCVYRSTW